MGSDIVELIKDIVKYLSSGLVEYFLECRVSDKRQEYFSNKGGKWAKFCFYMSLIVSILLIIPTFFITPNFLSNLLQGSSAV